MRQLFVMWSALAGCKGGVLLQQYFAAYTSCNALYDIFPVCFTCLSVCTGHGAVICAPGTRSELVLGVNWMWNGLVLCPSPVDWALQLQVLSKLVFALPGADFTCAMLGTQHCMLLCT